jgi:tetratricopeptide (TPR) repeat protein
MFGQSRLPSSPRNTSRFVLFGLLMVLAVLSVYGHTLQSPFLFDDRGNIVHNGFLKIETLNRESLSYVLQAPHPSARRKLANLTFALNYVWCGLETRCYHIVNIGIHSASALLAFSFFYQLLGVGWLGREYGSRRFWIAWAAAILWALHPINLNAVTYIVQRMTSMAGMFGLLALNCLLPARKSLREGWSWPFFLWSGGGIFFWVLGLLSKENLILLPLLILLTEVFLFRRGEFRFPWRFLLAFVALGIAWLAYFDLLNFLRLFGGYARRDFSLAERLLTQGRVLWHYVSLFVYPVADRFSLLYDYPVSRGWLRPSTTLPAVLGWFLSLGLAWKNRQNYPVFSWVVLWFLGGHLLESTILPLELVYEHRNYLPSISLSLGMVLAGVFLADRFSVARNARILFFCALLLIVGGGTYVRNLDYKDARTFYLRELKKFPESRRLRLNLAVTFNRMGEYSNGLALLQGLAKRYPQDITIQQNLFTFWSRVAGDEPKALNTLSRILNLIEEGNYNPREDSPALRRLALDLRRRGECPKALILIEKLLEDYSHYDSIWVMKGKCHGDLGDWHAARDAFHRALSLRPKDSAISFWYGKSLLEIGENNLACETLHRASQDPVRQNAAEMSKKLYRVECAE